MDKLLSTAMAHLHRTSTSRATTQTVALLLTRLPRINSKAIKTRANNTEDISNKATMIPTNSTARISNKDMVRLNTVNLVHQVDPQKAIVASAQLFSEVPAAHS